MSSESEFKELEPRLKFETRLKYSWFHLKLYSMFQDLSRFLAYLRRGSNSSNSDPVLRFKTLKKVNYFFLSH